MAETVNGTAINFSFASAEGITMAGSAWPGGVETNDGAVATAMAGIFLQNASYKKNSNRTLVKDGNGDRASSVHNDRFKSGTIKFVVSGTSLANAIVNTRISQPGSFVVITACARMPELVHATERWEIVGGDVSGANDGVKEVTLEIENSPGIQARAT